MYSVFDEIATVQRKLLHLACIMPLHYPLKYKSRVFEKWQWNFQKTGLQSFTKKNHKVVDKHSTPRQLRPKHVTVMNTSRMLSTERALRQLSVKLVIAEARPVQEYLELSSESGRRGHSPNGNWHDRPLQRRLEMRGSELWVAKLVHGCLQFLEMRLKTILCLNKQRLKCICLQYRSRFSALVGHAHWRSFGYTGCTKNLPHHFVFTHLILQLISRCCNYVNADVTKVSAR